MRFKIPVPPRWADAGLANLRLPLPGRQSWLGGIVPALLLLGLTGPVPAADAPHDAAHSITCNSCHITPGLPEGDIESSGGNANLCQSCHSVGGAASAKARPRAAQASPGPGLPTNMVAQGTSHRWDGNPMGRVIYLGGAATHSTGSLLPFGLYTGRYAKTYTITITAGGEPGSARFSWSASPAGGGGTNVVAGYDVPLSEGVRVSFYGGETLPSFRGGDRWQLLVRPDLTLPGDPEMLWRMTDGYMGCSTCHDQHSQAMAPFDPQAPAYAQAGGGAGRHFQRAGNGQDQMCWECHEARFVTNAVAGSHPVGVTVASNAMMRPPSSLPLDASAGQMWCSTCHAVHDSPAQDGTLLRAQNQAALCGECHTLADTLTPSSHLTRANATLWPGGQYGSQFPAVTDPNQRGSCGNCHQVHGWPNGSSPTNDYPALLVEREENLCYTCHDGSPVSKNLRANFTKAYSHPVSLSGRHSSKEDNNPANYGNANRHSECADCHNPHMTGPDATTPIAPAAANTLKGVARVSVVNVNSNTVNYVFRGAADPSPVKEYELCFLCHSGWTTQPSGQNNHAARFNEKNASFHPVEAVGRNTNINTNSFVNGWNGTRTMYCTDCHTSDDTTIRGPHGSAYRYILKKTYTASPAARTMSNSELCFDCHLYDTYANTSASSTIRNYSRFSGGNGHAYHVGSRGYPCYTCHETHGSVNQPNLLVTGRSPGINTYTRTSGGGSCNATCHGNESYSVTYPR
jgi:predicted CXXCH cytochrome family protein